MNGCVYRTEDDKCDFWSDHGKGIVSYCDFDDCKEKKPSNADRIRQMSDEELADEYIRIFYQLSWYTDSWAWLRKWLKSPIDLEVGK